MSEAAKPAAPKAAGRAGRNTELPEHLKAYKGVWVFIEHDRGHVHPSPRRRVSGRCGKAHMHR